MLQALGFYRLLAWSLPSAGLISLLLELCQLCCTCKLSGCCGELLEPPDDRSRSTLCCFGAGSSSNGLCFGLCLGLRFRLCRLRELPADPRGVLPTLALTLILISGNFPRFLSSDFPIFLSSGFPIYLSTVLRGTPLSSF